MPWKSSHHIRVRIIEAVVEQKSAIAAVAVLRALRGGVRDGTSGTGVRSLSPRFQPAAGENFF